MITGHPNFVAENVSMEIYWLSLTVWTTHSYIGSSFFPFGWNPKRLSLEDPQHAGMAFKNIFLLVFLCSVVQAAFAKVDQETVVHQFCQRHSLTFRGLWRSGFYWYMTPVRKLMVCELIHVLGAHDPICLALFYPCCFDWHHNWPAADFHALLVFTVISITLVAMITIVIIVPLKFQFKTL